MKGAKGVIRLRPYKQTDAEYICKWTADEYTFAQWCADKFTYPLTAEQLHSYYHSYEKDNKGWLMTALDQKGTPVGHLLMRRANYQSNSVHLGFIIVDSTLRGKGYGKEMVSLAVKYAFDILLVRRVTLGVFDNNPNAHYCYKAAGLTDEKYDEGVFPFNDEKWGIYYMAIER